MTAEAHRVGLVEDRSDFPLGVTGLSLSKLLTEFLPPVVAVSALAAVGLATLKCTPGPMPVDAPWDAGLDASDAPPSDAPIDAPSDAPDAPTDAPPCTTMEVSVRYQARDLDRPAAPGEQRP